MEGTLYLYGSDDPAVSKLQFQAKCNMQQGLPCCTERAAYKISSSQVNN